MAQHHSPMRWAIVSFTLVDNLITILGEKGILDDEDRAKLLGMGTEEIRCSPLALGNGAEDLFQELCDRP